MLFKNHIIKRLPRNPIPFQDRFGKNLCKQWTLFTMIRAERPWYIAQCIWKLNRCMQSKKVFPSHTETLICVMEPKLVSHCDTLDFWQFDIFRRQTLSHIIRIHTN